jgi:predicted MPP superfamily phosphohydrolase
MLRALFFALLPLALLGDARMFLFILNRVVFGGHKEERNPLNFLIWALPPILIGLTSLFWFLGRWIDLLLANPFVSRFTPERVEELMTTQRLAHAGAIWLLIAAAVGLYWVLDRIRINWLVDPRVPGTRTLPPELILMRKAHVPFASLRRLGAHNDIYDLEVTRHEVAVRNLPPEFEGYRIAFLTDTHVASFMRRGFYRECVAQVARFDPDLVLLGGDFVTWERHIPLMAELLLPGLAARDGVYAVLGNHDYWASADGVITVMTRRDIRFVINRSISIQRGEAAIHLLGIDEIYRGTPDVDAAFAGLPSSAVRLGLSHHPDVIRRLDGRRIDLLVCGHTHGGQIRVPFFGSVVVPSWHEARYAAGFSRRGDVLMYVSRGLGSVPPLRILCRPEVATFVLKAEAAGSPSAGL